MSIHIRFINEKAFSDKDNADIQMRYVHALNTAQTSGEFTICGTCVDGDGLGVEPSKITDEKISCPECIKMIKFCKSIKAKEIKCK
jgi:hypothetical protein